MKINFLTNNSQTIAKINQFIEAWNTQDSFIVNTSGSTGKPTKIRLHKEHMVNSAKMTGAFLNLKPGDTALLCLSIDTIGGKMMLVRSLVLGLELYVMEPNSDPLQSLEQKFDFAAMVPMQVEKSISNKRNLSCIKNLIIGGAPVSTELYDAIVRNELHAFQTFGMTETISHIAMRKIDRSHPPYQSLEGVSLHEDEGQLVIDAPHLGVHQLKTNDAVEIIAEGQFNWLGRLDFAINSGGVKIHPEIIENKIAGIIKTPFFVGGLPDKVLGEKLILCIEGKAMSHLTKETFETNLSKYEIPKEIYFFDKLHYTSSNKINRIKTLTNISDAEKQVL